MSGPTSSRTTLSTVGGGALPELFERELRRLLDNIADPNTKAEAMREITIKVKLKPTKSRESFSSTLECSSKLAPVAPVETTGYLIADDNKKLHAYSRDVRQEELFKAEQSGNVQSMRPAVAGD